MKMKTINTIFKLLALIITVDFFNDVYYQVLFKLEIKITFKMEKFELSV